MQKNVVAKQSKVAFVSASVKSFGVLRKFFLLLTLSGLSCGTWADASPPDPVVEIKTEIGTLRLQLNTLSAPAVVEDFVRLVEDGYFNANVVLESQPGVGLVMAKMGDSAKSFDFKDEAGSHTSRRGSFAINVKQTSDAYLNRLFVGYGAHPDVEKHYIIFGQVTEGLDVIEQSTTPGLHKVIAFKLVKSEYIESEDGRSTSNLLLEPW